MSTCKGDLKFERFYIRFVYFIMLKVTFQLLYYRWHKKTARNQLISLENNSRFLQTKSALIIKDVDLSDEGVYVCEVSNDFGKAHLDATLTVTGVCYIAVIF